MNEKLLVCNCGNCTHWEIGENFLICKSCNEMSDVPGLGAFLRTHVGDHPDMSWELHER